MARTISVGHYVIYRVERLKPQRHSRRSSRHCWCRYHHWVATLEDLEARIAALEASHADYRAVLVAVNAVGASQREMVVATLSDHTRDLAELKAGQAELTTGQRSLEGNIAEIKDLLVRARDR